MKIYYLFMMMRILKKLFLFVLPLSLQAQLELSFESQQLSGAFQINGAEAIIYDGSENVLIQKSAEFLSSDIEKVTGRKTPLATQRRGLSQNVIILGTITESEYIKDLVQSGKLNIDEIAGAWEGFIIQRVNNPFPGIDEALVIAGSDRRGVAFGSFTLSEKMGVSPWYWWADIPVQKQENIWLKTERYVSEGPSVKYRGIFINDEAPALRNWAKEKFGDFNHLFYEKVYELLLRNKANYLWPAMWVPSIFNEDDPLNPKLANDYGIVISTSHHEPLMRSHNEWYKFGGGDWNYVTNKEKLQEFWRGGIKRMGDYESVVTVGMRGDGDEAMSEETAVGLMQEIIADQREIIEEVTEKPAAETPQVWAVYKEVQDYYDKGMRVDDDIMVLFCDDNWGNLRILPKKKDLNHSGGYGLYYHFDFVGGPVSYRWLNTVQIERTWEQMNLAYQYGVKDLWLVNVGDIKPMELPISFFLDFAWQPEAIQAKDLPSFYTNWVEQQFGEHFTTEIAELLALYTKYNARRTPEMLKPDTYSLPNYREADRIVEEYNLLLSKAKTIYSQLPEQYQAAFYQLVLSPIEMCATVNEMLVASEKSKIYAKQGRASANMYAERVKELFEKDARLAEEFHTELMDGKWNHIMSQTHLGYTSWNNPEVNAMPPVFAVDLKEEASLGFAIENGKDSSADEPLSFSQFDNLADQSFYLEVFNKGSKPLKYQISTKEDWIKISKTKGEIQYDEKVFVSIDWSKVPSGKSIGTITLEGAGEKVQISVPAFKSSEKAVGFIETHGVVSMDANHFTAKRDKDNVSWTAVPNLGRTGSSMMISPVNIDRQTLENAASLEYDFTLLNPGEIKVHSYLSPTQDFRKEDGLHFAVSIDNQEPVVLNMNEGETIPDYTYPKWWNDSVGDHIKIRSSQHTVSSSGKHTLKIWALDPGVVFQKFVIDAGGLKESYLGPPESKYVKENK
ncbi:glycosyl hydrolase 115 family protein [Jiulongibacter sp. NS-SX5]|uniref:glycosyl hydrolase 115 family protein n=1 Tax=Jiulongibacter sp. NS-SX5 TaxID=3463854 RepID=UPI00405811C3